MDWKFAFTRARAGLMQVIGMEGEALACYRSLLAMRDDAACARVAALLAAKTGQLEEAAKWYAQAAAWEPADIETWFNLGYVRDALGNKREAIDAFRQAVHLAPHFDRAWHAIGSMHQALGEPALALEPLRRAQALQPQSAQLMYQIGQCQHACGNPRAVREAVNELLRLDRERARCLVEETGDKSLQRLLD